MSGSAIEFALVNHEAQEIKAQCALRRLDMPPQGIRASVDRTLIMQELGNIWADYKTLSLVYCILHHENQVCIRPEYAAYISTFHLINATLIAE